MYTCIYYYISIYIYLFIYINAAFSNGKQKRRRFSLILLPFANCTTEVCPLSVCWQRNKQKLSVCKWTKQTYPSMAMKTTFMLKQLEINSLNGHKDLLQWNCRGLDYRSCDSAESEEKSSLGLHQQRVYCTYFWRLDKPLSVSKSIRAPCGSCEGYLLSAK